jgi:hypothetical protein
MHEGPRFAGGLLHIELFNTRAALAPRRPEGHIGRMVEKSRTSLLEVSIEPFTPPRWGWQVKAGDSVVAEGFEKGRLEAKFEGYNAMFQLLAAGWKA